MYARLIIGIIVGRCALSVFLEYLNLRARSPQLPPEAHGWYNAEQYARSQRYGGEKTRLGIFQEVLTTAALLIFLLSGGFAWLDRTVRGVGYSSLITGVLFVGVLVLAGQIISLLFHGYETFGIEQRYGFNKTTLKTFIADSVKSIIVAAVLGGAALIGILWLFEQRGRNAWIDCWLLVTGVQIFVLFIAPVTIFPLFHTFTPLPAGTLRQEIEQYAAAQRFPLQGIFTIDGSRRTTKANAFFTGFGRFRRIALFDTLIERYSCQELLAVLAHEIGHYKKGHILKALAVSLAGNALLFYLLSFLIDNTALFSAFDLSSSVYASVVFAGFLFAPLQFLFALGGNYLSRRHEYEADAFSISTYRQPEALAAALQKLSADSLANVTPHPWYVFVYYSHPPALCRLARLRNMAALAAVPA